ncbi:MAG: hypothetical protein MI806_22555 [Minwuiales bacterium]|nr:hypothetical protein [Minwuiales bacterium]
MVAAIRQSTTAVAAPATSITVGPLSLSPLAGSLLLLAAGQDGGHTQSPPASDGWTKVGQYSSGGQSFMIAFKEATTGDTGSKTPTSDASDDFWSIYAELTGVSSSTMPNAINDVDEASGVTGNFPAVTPTVNDCIILLVGGVDNLAFGGVGNEPANYTIQEIADEGSVCGCLGFRVLSGGANVLEDPGNWTIVGGAGNDKSLVTMAIAPSADGGGTILPTILQHYHGGIG